MALIKEKKLDNITKMNWLQSRRNMSFGTAQALISISKNVLKSSITENKEQQQQRFRQDCSVLISASV